jgi:hypothetical protein
MSDNIKYVMQNECKKELQNKQTSKLNNNSKTKQTKNKTKESKHASASLLSMRLEA